jgi:hypothetical protein
MLDMCHKILISRDGSPIDIFKPGVEIPVYDITITSSTLNLADTAIITMPETIMNRVIDYQKYLGVGDYVVIQLGYDNVLQTEFEGYIEKMELDGLGIKVYCMDALFLFKKDIKDIQFKPASLKQIAEYVVSQIDSTYKVVCDFSITYEKFVIHQATGLNVLKKLQEDTKANVYFRTDKKELHIHPAFLEKSGDVIYSMQHNIETSNLSYKHKGDNKLQVIVEGTDVNGKVVRVTKGSTGGNSFTIKVGSIKESDLEIIADNAYKSRNRDQYEGTITTWLIPFVQSSYSAKIVDSDYPENTSTHYVETVETSFSENGGKRTITLGVRLV